MSNDKIIPVDEMDYEDNQKLVIFDDYVCESNHSFKVVIKLLSDLSQPKLL